MSTTHGTTAAQKRPALHKMIDEMPDSSIELVEKVLLKIELDAKWKQLTEDFAQDRSEGRYDRLNDIITEVRAEQRRTRQ